MIRFSNIGEAVHWLSRHPNAEYSRKHDALSLKPTSLRIVSAIDYLRSQNVVGAYISAGKHGTEACIVVMKRFQGG